MKIHFSVFMVSYFMQYHSVDNLINALRSYSTTVGSNSRKIYSQHDARVINYGRRVLKQYSMGFDFTEGCGKILSFDRFLPTETRKLNGLYFKVVAFTMVNFTQYAILFQHMWIIFCLPETQQLPTAQNGPVWTRLYDCVIELP